MAAVERRMNTIERRREAGYGGIHPITVMVAVERRTDTNERRRAAGWSGSGRIGSDDPYCDGGGGGGAAAGESARIGTGMAGYSRLMVAVERRTNTIERRRAAGRWGGSGRIGKDQHENGGIFPTLTDSDDPHHSDGGGGAAAGESARIGTRMFRAAVWSMSRLRIRYPAAPAGISLRAQDIW
ncbi:hypothetical protein DFH09DRAFT_1093192 [Mycena vulgaris]|nr:hypothetical protein DFH09DRAFT_1093192 [Mycena vulgaris]